MSEKSLRGLSPGVDQGTDAPARDGDISKDGGAAPDESWSGDRTEKVAGSGPRVVLVPTPAPADGAVDSAASTAETRRVVDIGRTTLMGLPGPVADREKPTSPGHDVHLPLGTGRVADALPTVGGVIPAIELDPSATRRIGKIEPLQQSTTGGAPPASESAAPTRAEEVEQTGGEEAANERTVEAAAATFRAGALQTATHAGEEPARGEPARGEDEGPDRDWNADRTQEFHLDDASPNHAFARAMTAGIALAVGLGILVLAFVHARLRAGESAERYHAVPPAPSLPAPPLPVALDKPALAPPLVTPDAPSPAAAAPPDPTVVPPTAARPPESGPAAGATQRRSPGTASDEREARRPGPRTEVVVTGGRLTTPRPARASGSPPRPSTSGDRPPATANVPAPVYGPASPPVTAPATPTAPPPFATAPPDKAPAKPYDPDMPLPPSAE